jgi:hypothetical protein
MIAVTLKPHRRHIVTPRADRACSACGGSGNSSWRCANCNGTGRGAGGFQCPWCHGRGWEKCKTPPLWHGLPTVPPARPKVSSSEGP